MNKTTSLYAECPFWLYATATEIHCENRKQPFETAKETKAYIKEYCKKISTCVNCINHKNLMKKYEGVAI